MSKRAKIILAGPAVLLLLVTAFLAFLPQILRWSVPRVIEAKSGYQTTIASVDVSIIKPAITISGISLQAAAGGEVTGKVARVAFSGAWDNPFRRNLIRPLSLMIKGVDAQLQLLEEGESESPSPDLDFWSSWLFQFQTVTLDAERLVMATREGLFKLSELRGSITPPEDQDRSKNRTLKGSLLLTAAVGTGAKSQWETQGHIALSGEITPQGNAKGVIGVNVDSLVSPFVHARTLVGNIPFSFENHTVKLQGVRLDAPSIRIQPVDEQGHPFALRVEPLQATLTSKPYTVTAQATVLADDLLSLEISLTGKAGQGLGGSFTLAIPELKSVTSHAAFQEKRDVLRYDRIALAGRLLIAGQFQLIMDQQAPSVVWQADCRMDTVRADYQLPVGTIGVTLQDMFAVRGRNAVVELSGDVGFTHLKIQSSLISIDHGAGRVQFSGDADQVEIKDIKVALNNFRFKHQPAVTFNQISLRGSGEMNVGTQEVRNAAAVFSIDGMGPFSLAVASLAPLEATLEAKGLSLRNVLDEIKPVAGFFEGWKMDGSLDLALRAQGYEDIAGDVTLHLASLSDPQGAYMAENLAAGVTLAANLQAFSAINRLEARVGIEQGEALLKRFYLDFGLTPFSLALNLTSAAKGVQIQRGTVELAKGITAQLHSPQDELFPVAVSLKLADLDLVFATFIQSALAEAFPILNDITVKGKASCDLSLQPDLVLGRLRLTDAALKIGSGLNLEDLALDLPLAYATGASPRPNLKPQAGKITLGLLETERFQLRNQEIGLRLQQNTFRFDPVRLPLADGTVLVSEAAIASPFSVNPRIAGRIALQNINLGNLQLLPPPYELTGILASDGLSISGNKQRIDASGELAVDLFEGHAVAGDVSIESPLSLFRRLKCNLRFEGIDLEKLTRAFSFGRVTGKLNGTIAGLAISNGQADAFTLEVRSVAAKGVARTVSFNAVEDLQTISSGAEQRSGLPFGLDRFIGDLSYDQIGIKCVLRNDAFKINGTIHKDHKEYFISRAGITGINVINMNPDNQISFKDMMERVKRVAEKREAEVQ